MGLKNINTAILNNGPSQPMPALFIGHGSPLNAIEDNEFVKGFRQIAAEIAKPKAILVISAHWETQGTQITAMEHPRTIHDFGGFPNELYEVAYPAPGLPSLARDIKHNIRSTQMLLDNQWGFDHGSWSVIMHMYPDADVPVIQLSLDYYKTPQQHYQLGKELRKLRTKGILIIGSGNIVHNLGLVEWRKLNEEFAYEWAVEANNKIKRLILEGNHTELTQFSKQGKAFQLSIPTPEHFLPLLYTLALQNDHDGISFFNDKTIGGSLSMTSVKIGQ